MANGIIGSAAKDYVWPINIYKVIYGLDSKVVSSNLNVLLGNIELLHIVQQYFIFRYFYCSDLYDVIADDLLISRATVSNILKNSINTLRVHQTDLATYMAEDGKKEYRIENVIKSRASDIPTDWLNSPDDSDIINLIKLVPNRKPLAETVKTSLSISHDCKVVSHDNGTDEETLIVPIYQEEFINPIGPPIKDYWYGAKRVKNSNMNGSSTEHIARSKGADGVNKSRKKLSKKYSTKDEIEDKLNIKYTMPGKFVPTPDLKICSDWPKNLFAVVFEVSEYSNISQDQIDGLNHVLNVIWRQDAVAFDFGIRYFKYGKTYSDLSREFSCCDLSSKSYVQRFYRMIKNSTCKEYLSCGLKGYLKIKNNSLQLAQGIYLSSTNLSEDVLRLLQYHGSFYSIRDVLNSSLSGIMSILDMSKSALLELYVLLVRTGFTTLNDGTPLVKLVDPKVQSEYLTV